MHRSADAGQRDASGALASPTASACPPSYISDRALVAWVHYLVRPLGSVCVLLHLQGSMEVKRKRRQTESGDRRGGWSKEDNCSQLYFILFHFIFIIVGF